MLKSDLLLDKTDQIIISLRNCMIKMFRLNRRLSISSQKIIANDISCKMFVVDE